MEAEKHSSQRSSWLRAAVLGANDGILSTASIIVGVTASNISHHEILLAGTAALVAGAMSMAAGEYVSVSSQSDAEDADLRRERHEIKTDPTGERRELAGIYESRGLDAALALQVADQLMRKNALAAHARDELGISDLTAARPVLAAFSSALAFSVGAILPLATAYFSPHSNMLWIVSLASLFSLALLGAIAAIAGGAPITSGLFRVTFWGALAMAVTAGVGMLFGTKV
jgi:VIT1/CCC1 family predicted Fe2+/Mn2+ transporter